jgi:hypothetical protein
MVEEEIFTFKNIIPQLQEISERKLGLICINYLLIACKTEDLYEFARKYGIRIPDKDFITRLEFIKLIAIHLTKIYYVTDLQKRYNDPLEYIGYALIQEPSIKKNLNNLDFIVKQDLIDVYADFCADSGVTVYNTLTKPINPKMDMYLAKKKTVLRTESIFTMTGLDINAKSYLEKKTMIENARSVANWNCFITTPIGALKIGLRKLIYDMIHLNCWLYIVDPSRKLIYGILKGKKNDEYNTEVRDEFIRALPREPLRAPSQLIKLSDYYFDESNSFTSEDFRTFEIYDELKHNKLLIKEEEQSSKYGDIFRDLIIMEILSGTPIVSYTSENFKEQALASGFLAAMDSYVSQIGGTKLEEINYKGFYVQAAYGKYTKLACFLSYPADKSLKDRLKYLIETFEENYIELIEKFRITGDTGLFNQKEIIPLIKEILNI